MPEEVERILDSFEGVQESYVYGKKSSILGNLIAGKNYFKLQKRIF